MDILMAQVTSGIRKILSHPFVYDGLQLMLGAKRLRQVYVSSYIKPDKQSRVLDIGCGTSEILEFLPTSVDYHGYDLSPTYIYAAEKRYGGRGTWHCDSVMDLQLDDFGAFDIVMANGVLHHLEDREAQKLSEVAFRALKSKGRLITIDPCFDDGQNPIARFLISRDRGQNVRDAEGYVALIKPHFDSVELFTRHDLLRVPYTHAIVVATKA